MPWLIRFGKSETRSNTEESGGRPFITFNLLKLISSLYIEEGITPAKTRFSDDSRLDTADRNPRRVRSTACEQLHLCERCIHRRRRDQDDTRGSIERSRAIFSADGR